MRKTFEEATRDQSGYIDQDTCILLVKRLDNQVATERVRQKLQVGILYIKATLNFMLEDIKYLQNFLENTCGFYIHRKISYTNLK